MPHLRDRLHFSTLMVFMEFCRTRSVSQTAANLDKSKAHVSVQLKTFAEQSGLTLYSRAGGHYYVNEQGLSIGKSIYHLANLNSFAATAFSAPDDWQHITIRIPMRYWGGGISQALMHAIGEVRRQYPAIFYYCEFLDDYHDFQYRQRSWLPETRSLGSIDIRYTSAGADISGRWLRWTTATKSGMPTGSCRKCPGASCKPWHKTSKRPTSPTPTAMPTTPKNSPHRYPTENACSSMNCY